MYKFLFVNLVTWKTVPPLDNTKYAATAVMPIQGSRIMYTIGNRSCSCQCGFAWLCELRNTALVATARETAGCTQP